MNQNAVKNIMGDEDMPLTLSPKIHGQVLRFLAQDDFVADLVDGFSSPLNIIFPEILQENADNFRRVYEENHLRGKIYFTTKPNKSLSLVRQAALMDVGADISSERALQAALGAGFNGERIEATGPKNTAYLALALQHGVTINTDNFAELAQIVALHRHLGRKEKVRIFVRLAGFHSDRLKFTPQDGTFGIHVDEAPAIFSFLEQNREDLDFQGFSFHFNAAVPEQKILAIETSLGLTREALNRGLQPRGLNMGGGFDISYAQSGEGWSHYVSRLKESVRDQQSMPLNWNGNSLGFYNENGLVRGAPNFMAHYNVRAGAGDLASYLATPLPAFNDMKMVDILKDCLLELYVEPGRALLDQAGITIGRVNHIKKSMQGETLVNLDMNRSNMHSTHQKLLTDPVIIRRHRGPKKACPEGVYYTGNLCLAYDMITYNKTFPDFLPEPGDLVVFINTAAYIMDFVESETLNQRVAEKVSVIERDGRFRWFRDEIYNPAVEVEK